MIHKLGRWLVMTWARIWASRGKAANSAVGFAVDKSDFRDGTEGNQPGMVFLWKRQFYCPGVADAEISVPQAEASLQGVQFAGFLLSLKQESGIAEGQQCIGFVLCLCSPAR